MVLWSSANTAKLYLPIFSQGVTDPAKADTDQSEARRKFWRRRFHVSEVRAVRIRDQAQTATPGSRFVEFRWYWCLRGWSVLEFLIDHYEQSPITGEFDFVACTRRIRARRLRRATPSRLSCIEDGLPGGPSFT